MTNRHPLFIDPLAESLALTTSGNVKNLIVGALELKGNLDPYALRDVVGEIGDTFPQLTMRVKEVVERGKHRLVWDGESQSDIAFRMWDVSESNQSRSGLDSLLTCLAPTLERERNLFEEPAGEIHLVKLARDHYLLALAANHVAADAMTFAEVAKEAMIRYHVRVTGLKLGLGVPPPAASTGHKRTVPKSKTVWKDYWTTCLQALIPYRIRCALPEGSGIPCNPGEHHMKRLLSPQETELIVARR